MTNIAAVVTRYFGGVKLGVRGLIKAYGETVETAINESPLKKWVTFFLFSRLFSCSTYYLIYPIPLVPEKNMSSPLNVPSIKADISTQKIVDLIRERRERLSR